MRLHHFLKLDRIGPKSPNFRRKSEHLNWSEYCPVHCLPPDLFHLGGLTSSIRSSAGEKATPRLAWPLSIKMFWKGKTSYSRQACILIWSCSQCMLL